MVFDRLDPMGAKRQKLREQELRDPNSTLNRMQAEYYEREQARRESRRDRTGNFWDVNGERMHFTDIEQFNPTGEGGECPHCHYVISREKAPFKGCATIDCDFKGIVRTPKWMIDKGIEDPWGIDREDI